MWLPEFLRGPWSPTYPELRNCKKYDVDIFFRCFVWLQSHTHELCSKLTSVFFMFWTILAEGAIALSVTLSGGALFASWKLLQFPSSLIVKVILAIFMGASAQQDEALLVVCWVKLCCEWSQFIHKLVVMLIHIGVTSCSWLCCHSLWCLFIKSIIHLLEEARKLTSSWEILLWMTPSEAPKALQASECSELLDPMRASCWIFAQH